MLVDLLIIGITIALAIWGYLRGFSADGLALIGFGGGALLGSRIAPLVLDGGLSDPFAPVLALPGALLFGALSGAAVERITLRARRLRLHHSLFDGLAGAAVAVCLGLIAVWILGATATKVDGFGDSVRDSAVLDGLNAVLPPPGPLLTAKTQSDPLPKFAGPRARVGPATPGIKRDPEVRAAADSVAKIVSLACGHSGSGSGWVAADGLVVTNAHVVRGSDEIRVQMEGRGRLHDAESIWYDARNDIAILRAKGVRGAAPLPIVPKPRQGTPAAVLGFPGGGPYTVEPARLGATAKVSGRRVGGEIVRREVTSLRAGVRPGTSGGPVVDGRGRVVTVIFAGRLGGHGAYGVPMPVVASALRRAGPPVDTGACREE